MVRPVRSVLTRPQSSARHDNAPGRWLLLAGLAVFGVALGGYVIYMVGHAKAYTMDPSTWPCTVRRADRPAHPAVL